MGMKPALELSLVLLACGFEDAVGSVGGADQELNVNADASSYRS